MTTTTTEIARWLTIRAASEYTMLSQPSIRRLISAGKLTARRPVRGRILLDRLELDSVIAGATARPRTGRGRRP
jgi:excisionase family DNA binding protein